MRVSNDILMNNVSVATSQNSSAYPLEQVYGVAIQAEFSGAPVGTVSLQGSCDDGRLDNTTGLGTAIVNWVTIVGSPTAVSGAGPVTWNYNGVFYKWIRVQYIAVSGSGNVTVTVNTKGA